MKIKEILLNVLDRKAIQSCQTDRGNCAFVILTDRYPELVFSPSPWPEQPSREEVIAFLQAAEVVENGPTDLTDSGFRFEVMLRAPDGTLIELRIRRIGGLLSQSING
ncbi:hypothetical protein JW905_07075 [bacterium]|nr:hypothetical protein [candidate division CSSED10-310 bacterium]